MNVPKPSALAEKNVNVEKNEYPPEPMEFDCLDLVPDLKQFKAPKPVREFKLKPHLTQRPLKNNEGLLALRERLTNNDNGRTDK